MNPPDTRIRVQLCRVPPHHPVSQIIKAQDAIRRQTAALQPGAKPVS